MTGSNTHHEMSWEKVLLLEITFDLHMPLLDLSFYLLIFFPLVGEREQGPSVLGSG